MHRLVKHATAALVLASAAPLIAQQPAAAPAAAEVRQPPAAKPSLRSVLPELKIGRAFDWLRGDAVPADEAKGTEEAKPAPTSQPTQGSETKPGDPPSATV